ncbi:GNAT family N-acetyltransferase [Kitasatospora paracochleata]|uniref:GNAT family N-acetyltransferase n=1 Tax=Kitasatospora paracochleata TaxID=58354 RepID=UPI0031D5D5A7
MTVTIREFRAADAEGAAAARVAGHPHLVTTPEVTAWQAGLPGFDVLVAERDRLIVGTARFGMVTDSATPGQAFLSVSVLPAERRRGAGAALLRAAERELAGRGATHVGGWVDDEPSALALAAAHGYRAGRRAHFASRDLTADLPPVPPVPAGVELRTAADFLDDPYPVYLVDIDAARSEPGDLEMNDQGYEEWLAEIWQRPDLDHVLTTVVVSGGEPVAFSAVQTDGAARYWSSFTATRAAHRGRGLAKLAKTDSLHRARAAGLTTAYTNNDATNAPMLAINTWLGYRRCASEVKHSREL